MYPKKSPQTASVVGATSIGVTIPPSADIGDLLFIVLAVVGAPTITTPTGYTTDANSNFSSANLTTKVFARILDGTEGTINGSTSTGTVTINWTGAQNAVAIGVAAYWNGGGTLSFTSGSNATASVTGTSYSRSNSAQYTGTKTQGWFTYAAGQQATGVDSFGAASNQAKVAEVYGGTTPFISLALFTGGTIAPQAFGQSLAVVATRIPTQGVAAISSLEVANQASVFSEGDIPGAPVNTEHLPALTVTETPVPGAAVNLEFAVIGSGGGGGSSAWPTSGQGWPRIKQG